MLSQLKGFDFWQNCVLKTWNCFIHRMSFRKSVCFPGLKARRLHFGQHCTNFADAAGKLKLKTRQILGLAKPKSGNNFDKLYGHTWQEETGGGGSASNSNASRKIWQQFFNAFASRYHHHRQQLRRQRSRQKTTSYLTGTQISSLLVSGPFFFCFFL